mmetsp:Transcript_6606/g.15972  ORF Transcript_6606/g.15972 Transcript_6606/m.15972 type:complete len:119 (+) Transcript_6606:1993-2349(+)
MSVSVLPRAIPSMCMCLMRVIVVACGGSGGPLVEGQALPMQPYAVRTATHTNTSAAALCCVMVSGSGSGSGVATRVNAGSNRVYSAADGHASQEGQKQECSTGRSDGPPLGDQGGGNG